MTKKTKLSAKAAQDLKHIAGQPARPQIMQGNPIFIETAELICLECGRLNISDHISCAACNAQLWIPCKPDNVGYLKTIDLLHSGQLAPEEINELINTLRRSQSFYMAGTLYSVFG